ncbi:MAG TPA: hypothetical protein VL330_01570 [Actinomycetes bacterium]|nr:hypothetical protein [Actinomycetes bacterium]
MGDTATFTAGGQAFALAIPPAVATQAGQFIAGAAVGGPAGYVAGYGIGFAHGRNNLPLGKRWLRAGMSGLPPEPLPVVGSDRLPPSLAVPWQEPSEASWAPPMDTRPLPARASHRPQLQPRGRLTLRRVTLRRVTLLPGTRALALALVILVPVAAVAAVTPRIPGRALPGLGTPIPQKPLPARPMEAVVVTGATAWVRLAGRMSPTPAVVPSAMAAMPPVTPAMAATPMAATVATEAMVLIAATAVTPSHRT